MDLKEIRVARNGTELESSDEETRGADILYGIDDTPPWYLSIPMAFQVSVERVKFRFCYENKFTNFNTLSFIFELNQMSNVFSTI